MIVGAAGPRTLVRRAAHLVLALLMAVTLTTATAPAVAADGPPPAVQPSSDFPDDVNRRLTELQSRIADLPRRANEIAAQRSALDGRIASYNQRSQAVLAQLETNDQKITQHNARVDAYPGGAPPEVARTLNAEADALNAEQAQLKEQAAAIADDGDAIKRDQDTLDSRAAQLDTDRNTLHEEYRALLVTVTGILQSFVDAALQGPAPAPRPAGGDVARPTGRALQEDAAAVTGGDTASPGAEQSAFDLYAAAHDVAIDPRPVTAVLTPEAVQQLPTEGIENLRPQRTFDALVPKGDDTYTALTTGPADSAFDTAVNAGGRAVAPLDGRKIVIDAVEHVPELDPPDVPALTAAPAEVDVRRAVTASGLGHKITDPESLRAIRDSGKVADLRELLSLLGNGKISGTAQLARLLERVQSGRQLAELLPAPVFADGSALEHLAEVMRRAGYPKSLSEGEMAVPRLVQLATPDILNAVEATLVEQEAGRIVGLADWLWFNRDKAEEIADAAVEMGDARRLARHTPGRVVRIGREGPEERAHQERQRQNPAKEEKRRAEYDLSVETPQGEVLRLIEIRLLEKPVSKANDVNPGVTHAQTKVNKRQGLDTGASKEAIVHMRLDIGRKNLGGSVREVLPDGTVNIRRRDDDSLIRTSNFFDDIPASLGRMTTVTLDRVIVVDDTSGRWYVYEREGTTWRRA